MYCWLKRCLYRFMILYFRALAVYGDPVLQCRCLITLAAGIVGWDVLLSPSRDRSTLLHFVLWPIASFWRVCFAIDYFFSEQVD